MSHRSLSALLAFLCVATAQAQTAGTLDSAFDPNVSSSSAIVNGLAVQTDLRVVFGGAFSIVGGQTRQQVARVAGADGAFESSATFNPGTGPNAQVSSVIVQADGKILLGGNFASVNGNTRGRIARLLPDGTVEGTGTFNPGTGVTTGVVSCLAVQADGRILLGGTLTGYNGTPRSFLARIEPNGALDTSFNPAILPSIGGHVNSIAVQADGKIVIGGSFTTVNGVPRNNLARLNSDGSTELAATFDPGTGPNAEVQAVLVQPDGKILVSGYFAMVNGTTRNAIARLNANGTLESSATFNPGTGPNFSASSMALQADGKILLAGLFMSFNGQARSRIARINSDGTLESTTTFNVGTSVGGSGAIDLYALTLQGDGRILIGGQFTTFNGTSRGRIARLLNDSATQTLTVPDLTRVQWLRSGATPEVEQVTFELSTDGGTIWSPLGNGTRIAGGWERTGLSLPTGSGQVRARGRAVGGFSTGSSHLVQSLALLPAPQLVVEQPLGASLANGATRSFGTIAEGQTSSLTFTIKNVGAADLTGLGITKSGPDAALVTVTTPPVPPVPGPNGSTTFTVQFAPLSGGTKTAALQIASNDTGQNPFVINLTGLALSYGTDTDGDGLSDAAELRLAALGFDWQAAQPALVAALFANANAAGLYTTAQVQALNVGTPLLSRDIVTGEFTLRLGLKKSTDLQSFTAFPFTAPGTTINGNGEVEYRFTLPGNAAFLRLQTP